MKTGHDYFVEYQKEFEDCSDEEVLKWFNREVNNGGSGTARFSFLHALHQEFIRRGYDYSEIGDEKSLSFKHKVTLENKTIKIVLQ